MYFKWGEGGQSAKDLAWLAILHSVSINLISWGSGPFLFWISNPPVYQTQFSNEHLST